MSEETSPQTTVTIAGREFKIGAWYGPKTERGWVLRRLLDVYGSQVNYETDAGKIRKGCWAANFVAMVGDEVQRA